ncbi:uncharacterized protein CIMG_12871 [Coccidioides immitis RS]|uniref:Uncharacterized protein n=1 Tax=Coccidioides immitis (strain RS) TaxID=246410 RepID=A0A0D8JVK5_COCIM|nr:uncharacterized protein CIMG_12871 [Coccidioides immitis RS]KJF60308.1 hypothetical protein CIMG_12871 [Coccidioides immitis RS]
MLVFWGCRWARFSLTALPIFLAIFTANLERYSGSWGLAMIAFLGVPVGAPFSGRPPAILSSTSDYSVGISNGSPFHRVVSSRPLSLFKGSKASALIIVALRACYGLQRIFLRLRCAAGSISIVFRALLVLSRITEPIFTCYGFAVLCWCCGVLGQITNLLQLPARGRDSSGGTLPVFAIMTTEQSGCCVCSGSPDLLRLRTRDLKASCDCDRQNTTLKCKSVPSFASTFIRFCSSVTNSSLR